MGLIFKIGFQADTKGLEGQLSTINQEVQRAFNVRLNFNEHLSAATHSAKVLGDTLTKATTAAGLSAITFNSELRKAGLSSGKLLSNLTNGGSYFVSSLNQANIQLALADRRAITLSAKIQSLHHVFSQSLKFSAAQAAIRALASGLRDSVKWVTDLHDAFNDIAIVTGKSNAEIKSITQQSIKAAKDLRVAAKEYAEGALIFYQQGLDDTEVQRRTQITIKAAKAAGESVDQMASQLTAIWNTYGMVGAEQQRAASVGAKMAAETAVSFQDIAEAMQTAAAPASQMGVSFNSLAAIIATVGDATQQSASIIGNAYKTIFARMEQLKSEGSDGEVTLGKVSQTLKDFGINIYDQAENLKDLDVVIQELGGSWKSYREDQQLAIAQAVGGTRQYGQFLALMQNFDKYQRRLRSANREDGSTLEEQYATSLDSIESRLENLGEAWKRAFSDLFPESAIKGVISALENVGNLVGDIVKTVGGLPNILLLLGATLGRKLIPMITNAAHQTMEIATGMTAAGRIKSINQKYDEQDIALQREAQKPGADVDAIEIERKKNEYGRQTALVQEEINNKLKTATGEERLQLEQQREQLVKKMELFQTTIDLFKEQDDINKAEEKSLRNAEAQLKERLKIVSAEEARTKELEKQKVLEEARKATKDAKEEAEVAKSLVQDQKENVAVAEEKTVAATANFHQVSDDASQKIIGNQQFLNDLKKEEIEIQNNSTMTEQEKAAALQDNQELQRITLETLNEQTERQRVAREEMNAAAQEEAEQKRLLVSLTNEQERAEDAVVEKQGAELASQRALAQAKQDTVSIATSEAASAGATVNTAVSTLGKQGGTENAQQYVAVAESMDVYIAKLEAVAQSSEVSEEVTERYMSSLRNSQSEFSAAAKAQDALEKELKDAKKELGQAQKGTQAYADAQQKVIQLAERYKKGQVDLSKKLQKVGEGTDAAVDAFTQENSILREGQRVFNDSISALDDYDRAKQRSGQSTDDLKTKEEQLDNIIKQRGSTITGAVQNLSSFAMTISMTVNSVKNFWETLNNPDATFGEKLMSLIMLLGTLGGSFSSLMGIMKSFNDLSKIGAAIKEKEIVTTGAKVAANKLEEKSQEEVNKEEQEGVNVKGEKILTEGGEVISGAAVAGTNKLEEVTQEGANRAANRSIGAAAKKIASNVGMTISNITTAISGAAAHAAAFDWGTVAVILGLLAAIGASVAISRAHGSAGQNDEREKNIKGLEESYNNLKETAAAAQEKADELAETANNFDSAADTLSKCTKNTKEWEQALDEVNKIAQDVIRNNKNLTADQIEILNGDDIEAKRKLLHQLSEDAQKTADNTQYAADMASVKLDTAKADDIKKDASAQLVKNGTLGTVTNALTLGGEFAMGMTSMSALAIEEAQREAIDKHADGLTGLPIDQLREKLESFGVSLEGVSDDELQAFADSLAEAKNMEDAAKAREKAAADEQAKNILGPGASKEAVALASSQLRVKANEEIKDYKDKLTGSGISKGSGSDNEIYQQMLKDYAAATGADVKEVKGGKAVMGTDENRTFKIIVNGEEQELTADQIAGAIGSSQASKAIDPNEINKKLQNLDNIQKSVLTEGGLEGLNREDFNKFLADTGGGNKKQVEAYLKNLGLEGDALQEALDQTMKNIDIDWDSLTDSLNGAGLDEEIGKKLGLGASQALADTLSSMPETMHETFTSGLEDMVSGLSGDTQIEAMERLAQVDWSDWESMEQAKSIMADYGVEIDLTSEKWTEYGNAMREAMNAQITQQQIDALKEQASQYENTTKELEDFEKAVQSGNQQLIAQTEAALKAATSIGQLSEQYGLDAKVVEKQAKAIQAANKAEGMSIETATALAIANQRMNKGVKTLNENFKDWRKTIESNASNSMDYADAVVDLEDALKDLLNLSDDFELPEGWVDMPKNLNLIEKAAKGDQNAINELGASLAQVDFNSWTYQASSLQTEMENLRHKANFEEAQQNVSRFMDGFVNAVRSGTEEAQAYLDQNGEDFAQNFNKMAENAQMSAEEVRAALLSMGVEAEVTTKEVTLPAKIPRYETTTNVTRDDRGEDGLGEYVQETSTRIVDYDDVTETKLVGQINVGNPPNSQPPKLKYTGVSGGKTGGGVSPSSTGGGSGGGGGGGGNKPETVKELKEKKFKKDEVKDRYASLKAEVDAVSRSIERLNSVSDQAWGAKKIASLEKTNKLLQEQSERLKNLNDAAKKNLQNDQIDLQARLSTKKIMGATFTEDGFVSNKTEILEQLNNEGLNYQKAIDEAIDNYNKLFPVGTEMTEDVKERMEVEQEKIDAAQKAYDTWKEQTLDPIQEALDTVDESAQEVQDSLQKMVENISTWFSNKLEAVQVRLDLKLSIRDQDIALMDRMIALFENSTGPGRANLWDNYSKQLTTYLKQVEISVGAVTEIQSMLNNLEKAMVDGGNVDADLKKWFEDNLGGEEAFQKWLKGNGALPAEALEKIKEITDNAWGQIDSAKEHLRSMFEEWVTMFEYYMEEFDKLENKVTKHQDTIEMYNNLLTTLGKDQTASGAQAMLNLAKTSYDNSKTAALIAKDKLEFANSQLADANAALEAFTEQYGKTEEEILAKGGEGAVIAYQALKTAQETTSEAADEALSNFKSTINDMASAMSEILEANTTALRSAFIESITDIFTDWSSMTEMFNARKEFTSYYLDKLTKDYNLDKLGSSISQYLKDADLDYSALEKYDDLMADINKKKAAGVNITQLDYELLEKQFELAKAQDAYEEAQRQKNTMRLARDASGNYNYIYSTSSAAEQEQALQRIKDLQYEIAKAEQDAAEAAEEAWVTSYSRLGELYEQRSQAIIAGDTNLVRMLDEQIAMENENLQRYADEIDLRYGHIDKRFEESTIFWLLGQQTLEDGTKISLDNMSDMQAFFVEKMDGYGTELAATSQETAKSFEKDVIDVTKNTGVMITSFDELEDNVKTETDKMVTENNDVEKASKDLLTQAQKTMTDMTNSIQTEVPKHVTALKEEIDKVRELHDWYRRLSAAQFTDMGTNYGNLFGAIAMVEMGDKENVTVEGIKSILQRRPDLLEERNYAAWARDFKEMTMDEYAEWLYKAIQNGDIDGVSSIDYGGRTSTHYDVLPEYTIQNQDKKARDEAAERAKAEAEAAAQEERDRQLAEAQAKYATPEPAPAAAPVAAPRFTGGSGGGSGGSGGYGGYGGGSGGNTKTPSGDSTKTATEKERGESFKQAQQSKQTSPIVTTNEGVSIHTKTGAITLDKYFNAWANKIFGDSHKPIISAALKNGAQGYFIDFVFSDFTSIRKYASLPDSIRSQLKFDTGGYTGEWGSDGRLAMLHEKELVLNKEDTQNILAAVHAIRAFVSSRVGELTLHQFKTAQENASISNNLNATPVVETPVQQSVQIEASFPNVSSADEIQEALNNLVNQAVQYAAQRQ